VQERAQDTARAKAGAAAKRAKPNGAASGTADKRPKQ
jgi:hypothetical protein